MSVRYTCTRKIKFINFAIKMLYSFGEVLYLGKKILLKLFKQNLSSCQVVKSKGHFNLKTVVITI